MRCLAPYLVGRCRLDHSLLCGPAKQTVLQLQPPASLPSSLGPPAAPRWPMPAGKVGPDGQLLDEQAPNSNHCPWELYMPGTTHQVGGIHL